MKRIFNVIPVLVIISLLFSACGLIQLDLSEVKVIEKDNSTEKNDEKNGNSDLADKEEVLKEDTGEYIGSVIGDRAKWVLSAIKDYDMEKLSEAIHPEKGVRFSPYGYVDVENNLVFTAEKVAKLGTDDTRYLWGSYDGSGEPIELTFKDYYSRFIFDLDFTDAPETGYNQTLGKGNTLDNSAEVYKNSIIIEYHFPGVDPKYEGMDWRSLRLVFEKLGDTWYIVGIIHDQWTI